MTNSMIHSSEWEDLETELRRNRRSKDEFIFEETVAPMRGAGDIESLHGTVTITDRISKASRTYQTGHGSKWVAEFERDLATGAFRA